MSSRKKLKICVASTGLGHVTRGVESWAQDMGRALLARGENVIVCQGGGTVDQSHQRIIPCWKRDSRPNQRLLRCLPNAIAWRIGLGTAYTIEQSTFAFGLLRLLRRETIDVLHVQDHQLALLMQRAAAAGFIATRTILGHATDEPIEQLYEINYLQHIAPWHEDQCKRLGKHKNSWTTVPYFIDTEKFCPGDADQLRKELSIPIDAEVVLVSSAIKSTHKRVDYLVDEFAALLHRNPGRSLFLIIAGGQEQETDVLIRRANQLLGDRVRFLIQFPRDRMPELYRAADVFIHGSLFEMFGMVLLEASATGIPCIVHKHPVMQWVVGSGGLTCDLTVPGNMADAISQLLDNKNERKRRGELAIRHCHEIFSRDVVVDQHLQYYQQVLSHEISDHGKCA